MGHITRAPCCRSSLVGSQVVGLLDDEVITDPHEIVAHDPRRGVDWTVDVYNMGN